MSYPLNSRLTAPDIACEQGPEHYMYALVPPSEPPVPILRIKFEITAKVCRGGGENGGLSKVPRFRRLRSQTRGSGTCTRWPWGLSPAEILATLKLGRCPNLRDTDSGVLRAFYQFVWCYDSWRNESIMCIDKISRPLTSVSANIL